MTFDEKVFKDNAKKYYSEKEINVIESASIFFGQANATKTSQQEETLKIYRNILGESLEQRIWEIRKYYWAFFIFVILILAVVFGWFWGHRKATQAIVST